MADEISKGRMDAIESRMSAPKSDEGGEDDAFILEDVIDMVKNQLIPQADEAKAAKLNQALAILESCYDEESEEAPAPAEGGGAAPEEVSGGGFPGV